MTLEEANEILSETTVYIYKNSEGRYMWSAIMGESTWSCDTVQEAYDEAVYYINRGGY